MENKKRPALKIGVSEEAWREFRSYIVADGFTVTQFFADVIEKYVSSKKNKNKHKKTANEKQRT